MNRDWPAYAAEMERRGGLRVGRELSLPEEGVTTIRVRNGETLATDGPFLETKEYVGGIDLFESADLDEAIEVESMSPVARFLPFEIRPLPEAFRFGPKVAAFGESDDSEGIPYLLTVWVEAASADSPDSPVMAQECEVWRTELENSGVFVLGGAIGAPETATTLRVHGGEVREGPFLDVAEFIGGLEVVRGADSEEAAELAASHPLARHHAIEVRPFYSEAA
ncbi:MAG TPA: YciI family protein [Solirubrobacteraceae bacterium]|jgi:hypothetical protein|nr:YciI family protein [Solirubrobacteraceae bacterium]